MKENFAVDSFNLKLLNPSPEPKSVEVNFCVI